MFKTKTLSLHNKCVNQNPCTQSVPFMEKIFIYKEEGIIEVSLLTYYPAKYQESLNLSMEDLITSQFILDFKNGHKPASILAAKIVASVIEKHFDLTKGPIVFIPIPASNREDSKKRYHLFSYLVSQYCQIVDGQHWVKNWREVDKKHLSSSHAILDDHDRWFVNYSLIKNKQVVIFDDIATTGETASEFTQRLTKSGAKVIGKVFLASTYKIKHNHLDR